MSSLIDEYEDTSSARAIDPNVPELSIGSEVEFEIDSEGQFIYDLCSYNKSSKAIAKGRVCHIDDEYLAFSYIGTVPTSCGTARIKTGTRHFVVSMPKSEHYSSAQWSLSGFIRPLTKVVKKCECGAESTLNNNLHSSWCPKFT